MDDFNQKVLDKLTEIRIDLATSLNEQSHLKIKIKEHESEIDALKVQHDLCPARKRSEGLFSLLKDFMVISACISAIVTVLKYLQIKPH